MTKLEIRELNERWRALEAKGSVKEKRRERGCDERGTAVARRRGEAFPANDLQESLAKCETQNDNDGKHKQEGKTRGSLASFVNSRKREWIKS